MRIWAQPFSGNLTCLRAGSVPFAMPTFVWEERLGPGSFASFPARIHSCCEEGCSLATVRHGLLLGVSMCLGW